MYDSIRRIDKKEEKIKKIIQNNHLLSALEQYQLVEDFEDEDILRILKALQLSLGSFSTQALLGLLKVEDNLIEGFLLMKDKMELNDLVSLINRIHRPLTKLRMIEMCKNQFNVQSFIRLLNATKNTEIAEKIIELWNQSSLEKITEEILGQIENLEIRKRLEKAFSKRQKAAEEQGNSQILLEISEKFMTEGTSHGAEERLLSQPSFIYKEMEKISGIVPGYLQKEALQEIVNMTTEHEMRNKTMEY